MSVELTDREHEIIQQLILDRWNPHRINKKIANHHGPTINQVKYMRSKPAFKGGARQAAGHLSGQLRRHPAGRPQGARKGHGDGEL